MLLIVSCSLPLYAYDCCVDGVYYNLNSSVQKKAYVAGCEDNVNTIIIPETVSIDGRPYDVGSICGRAFENKTNLVSITISKQVETIGFAAFRGCSSLREVVIEDGGNLQIDDSYSSSHSEKYYHGGHYYYRTVYNYSSAFYGCPLEHVYLGRNISLIGNKRCSPFIEQKKLTSLELGDSISNLTDFSYCTSLKEVVLPNSIEYIQGFSGCSSLEHIQLSQNLTEIHSFRGCHNLCEIEIPENATSIDYEAFYDCSSLKEILIPDKIVSIGQGAFEGCSNLMTLSIGKGVVSVGASAFRDCLFNEVFINCKNVGKWFEGSNSIRFLTFGDNVETIDENAFSHSSLERLEIGKNVKEIGNHAFYCSGGENSTAIIKSENVGDGWFAGSKFTNVVLSDNVKTICCSGFADCKELSSIYLGNSIDTIGENAFYRCYNLKEVIFPKSLIEIGKYAFSEAGLCKVEIPNNVTTIGYGAFSDCDSLSVLLIGNQVSSIGEFAFSGCTNLKSVVIPNSVTELKSSAFGFCESLKSVTLSENLTYISEGLFCGCKNLLNISIPEKILMIESNAFQGCESLTILEIPNNVESIGDAAFIGCEKLSTVTIGSNVKTIEHSAFLGCNISVVYALSTSAPKITDFSFDTKTTYHYSDYGWLESTSYTINATLYVPYGCKSSYTYYSVISREPLELSNYWHRFKKIKEIEIHEYEKKAEAIAKYNEGLSLYNSFVELNSKVRSAYDQLIYQQKYNLKLGDEIEREISELKGDIEAFDFDAEHKAYFLNVLDSIDKKSYVYVKWTYGHGYDYLISEFDNTKNAFENFIERLEEYKNSIVSATTNSELEAITEQIGIDNSNIEAICQSSWEIDYNSMLQFIDVCKGYEAELLKLLQRLKDLKTELSNTTSGIDTIVSTDADMVIYTLIGERLPIKANQIKSLPKGIYIINGKKILIQ